MLLLGNIICFIMGGLHILQDLVAVRKRYGTGMMLTATYLCVGMNGEDDRAVEQAKLKIKSTPSRVAP